MKARDISGLALVLAGGLAIPFTAGGAETPSPQTTEPTTYRLFTLAALRETPGGRVVDLWDSGTTFTSNVSAGSWVRVTGHFPDGTWQKSVRELWVRSEYAKTLPNRRGSDGPDDGIERYIVIDKNTFELKVFEKKPEGDQPVYETRVALGMDRCLPEEKGGRCYYTEPGEYKVRWKVFDQKGIEWCIPKSMEKEYPDDVAAGQRCFRGPLGYHALNIGKTYAIHGTNRPEKLGRKVSHGCVRAANGPMKTLYSLMDVGDPVYIRE